MFLLFDWVTVALGTTLHLCNSCNYKLDLPGLSANKQVSTIAVGASCDSSCGNVDLQWTENETQKHTYMYPLNLLRSLLGFSHSMTLLYFKGSKSQSCNTQPTSRRSTSARTLLKAGHLFQRVRGSWNCMKGENVHQSLLLLLYFSENSFREDLIVYHECHSLTPTGMDGNSTTLKIRWTYQARKHGSLKTEVNCREQRWQRRKEKKSALSPGRRNCGQSASASGSSLRPAWRSLYGTGGQGHWS